MKEEIAEKWKLWAELPNPNRIEEDKYIFAESILSLIKEKLLENLPTLKVENWTENIVPMHSIKNKVHNDIVKEVKTLIENTLK